MRSRGVVWPVTAFGVAPPSRATRSLAKEEARKQKPLRVTLCGGPCPRPAKAEPQPEPSVARDPVTETRSVHREHAGHAWSPEKGLVEEADVVARTEGNTPGLKARSFPGAPPGSETMARVQGGHPGTWEALLSVPVRKDRHYGGREGQPKRRRRTAGSRSALLPKKQGNSPHGDPAEG